MDLFREIRNRFGEPINSEEKNGHTEFQYYCPFCLERKGSPDRSGHLFVRSDTGVYHCYRCEAKGAVVKTSKNMSVSDKMLMEDISSFLSTSNNDKKLDTKEIEYPYIIPNKSIFDNSIAHQYMLDRGFSDEELKYYDVRVGSIMNELAGRVIIPNMVKDKVYTDMYVARSYVGAKKRYLNPPTSKSGINVFNLFRIPQNPEQIIICEGPITAMAAGKDAVALYGKACSPAKLRLILDKNPRSIVVNLDPDAEHTAIELASLIKRMDNKLQVKLLINPVDFKDAADYKKLNRINEYRELVDNALVFNELMYKTNKGWYHNDSNT